MAFFKKVPDVNGSRTWNVYRDATMKHCYGQLVEGKRDKGTILECGIPCLYFQVDLMRQILEFMEKEGIKL